MTDPTAYGLAALERECAKVRYAKKGTRNDALNTAAFSLGSLVPDHLPEALVIAALTEAALIGSGDAKGDDPVTDDEITATLSSGLSAGMDQPRQVPDGYGDRLDALADLDDIVVAFDATPMGGWEGRRCKQVMPGILQIAYQQGGPRNVPLPITRLAVAAGMSSRRTIAKGLDDLEAKGWLTCKTRGGPGRAARYDLHRPKDTPPPGEGGGTDSYPPTGAEHPFSTSTEPLHGEDAPTLLTSGKWERPQTAVTGHDAGRAKGLGPTGIRILQALHKAGGWTRVADLARATGMHPSTISRHLKAPRPLGRLGLVERDERRRVRLVVRPDLPTLDRISLFTGTIGARDRDRRRIAAYFQIEGFLTPDLEWIDQSTGTTRNTARWLRPENPLQRIFPDPNRHSIFQTGIHNAHEPWQ